MRSDVWYQDFSIASFRYNVYVADSAMLFETSLVTICERAGLKLPESQKAETSLFWLGTWVKYPLFANLEAVSLKAGQN